MTVKRLKMDQLGKSRRTGKYDLAKVKHYRLALRRRERLRPIDVQNYDDGRYLIFDGFHRYRAHKLEGRKTILVRLMFA